jgi:two-component system sensor histidine kinase KdpD
MIRTSRRGKLKVYLGYSPGVGKTYHMLQEGHRLKAEGIDVVIGLVETHGREAIAKLAQGLEVVPRKRQEYRGIIVEEMDADAVLTRNPQVALIDELAHTNAPNSRNAKRYEDVQDILAAGIHVMTTLNVQHLESLYNIVENATGVKVRERLPDSVLGDADQIVDVDLATEDLRKRLEEGKIYPPDRIAASLVNFFTPSNLDKLRELTLRELASQIDLRRRSVHDEESGSASDQVLVCLSSHGPNSEKLLRFGSRLAGKLNRNWYAVYVQTPSEEALVIDAQTQRILSDTLTLAKQLGALVFTYKGEDIVDTILRFAKEYRVGHIVVGRSGPKPLWKRFGKNKAVVESLVKTAKGVAVIVLDTCDSKTIPAKPNTETAGQKGPLTSSPKRPFPPADHPLFSPWLSADHILLWEDVVAKNALFHKLAASLTGTAGGLNPEALFAKILAREELGSTFFNEGVAFPHVRLDGLSAPLVALGLTHAGVADVSTEKPVELVVLILSPAHDPDMQVKLLGMAGRLAQNRHLRGILRSVRTPDEALAAIRDWEHPG